MTQILPLGAPADIIQTSVAHSLKNDSCLYSDLIEPALKLVTERRYWGEGEGGVTC